MTVQTIHRDNLIILASERNLYHAVASITPKSQKLARQRFTQWMSSSYPHTLSISVCWKPAARLAAFCSLKGMGGSSVCLMEAL